MLLHAYRVLVHVNSRQLRLRSLEADFAGELAHRRLIDGSAAARLLGRAGGLFAGFRLLLSTTGQEKDRHQRCDP